MCGSCKVYGVLLPEIIVLLFHICHLCTYCSVVDDRAKQDGAPVSIGGDQRKRPQGQ